MSAARYRLSFTTGGLFLQEAPVVVERYLVLGDWKTTRDQIRSENLLQVRTSTAATRISKELISRLELLSTDELQYLITASRREQTYLLWSATCRRYAFIRDFAVDILREHFITLRYQITHNDFDAFTNSKAVWHAELDELAPSTLQKLRSNLFRMLRDADLLSDAGLIQPAMLTPALAKILAHADSQALLVFPVTDMDIKRWLQ